MLKTLISKEENGTPIRVGLIGAGAMGKGIAYQLSITPGMQLVWVFDNDQDAALEASKFDSNTIVADSMDDVYRNLEVDVMVEATNSIQSALSYCEEALKNKVHVVLMNAEVDLAFGPYLKSLAESNGVHVTSDAGDQHGVLADMIEEISLWGFRIVQAGNIKGFLDKYATAKSLEYEAKIRNLNPIQCCAYTDGSKLNIEMAVLANAKGYKTMAPGMQGSAVKTVEEALEVFDFDEIPEEGAVDYILGAEPGGGVYVVGYCDSDFQVPFLKYYKVKKAEKGYYYLFYRPYHLCHLETPKAIYRVAVIGESLLEPVSRKTEVYAYAKDDFSAGTVIEEAIGSEVVYGVIHNVDETQNFIPQVALESEGEKPVLKNDVKKDQILTKEDIEWRDSWLYDRYYQEINQPG